MKDLIKIFSLGMALATINLAFADETYSIPQRFEGCYSGVCLFKDGEYLQGFAEVGKESLWMSGEYEVRDGKVYLESFARNEPFEVYAGYDPTLKDKMAFIYHEHTDTKAQSLLLLENQSPIELVDKYARCTIKDNCEKERVTANISNSFQLVKKSPINNQKIIQTYQIPPDKNTFLVISYGYQNSVKFIGFADINKQNNAWYFQPCLKEGSHRLYTAEDMGVRWGQVLASKAVIDEMSKKGKPLWVNNVGGWHEMSYYDLEDYNYDQSNNLYISKSFSEREATQPSEMPSMQFDYDSYLKEDQYFKPELINFDKVRLYEKLFYTDISPTKITPEEVLNGEITRDLCLTF